MRPIGSLPVWATNTLYPVSAEPWSATPTKVDPGAGLRALGLTPKDKLPAQHLNYDLNQIGLWLDHMANMQVQNWLPGDVKPAASATRSIAYQADAREVDDIDPSRRPRYWAVLDDTDRSIYSSFDGITWDTYTLGGASTIAFTQICAITSGAHIGKLIVSGEVGADNELIYTLPGGGVGALPGTTPVPTRLHHCAYLDMRIVGGYTDTLANVAIWTAPDTSTFTARTLANSNVGWGGAGAGDTGLRIASSGAIVVAMYQRSDGSTRMWTSTDGITWTERNPSMTYAAAICYNPERAMFMLTCLRGSVYTSPDGITWTSRAATPAGEAFAYGCLAGRGSLWVAGGADYDVGGTFPTVGQVRYSTDDGATWKRQVLPRYMEPTDLIYGDGEFIILADDIDHGSSTARCMRVGYTGLGLL